jgi:hypothetical protein
MALIITDGTNSKVNWERRLRGEVISSNDPNRPDYGFYRIWQKVLGTWWPIAYWYAPDGTLRCEYNGERIANGDEDGEARAIELWQRAIEHPIVDVLYRNIADAIKQDQRPRWPDLNEAVARSNLAPDDDSLEGLQAAIEEMVREAEKLLKKPVADKDTADQLAHVSRKLLHYNKRADSARETEKRPHLQASRDVDAKWRPVIAATDIYKRLNAWVGPFLTGLREAKRKAQAEAERKAQEAAAEAKRLADEAEALQRLPHSQRAAEEAVKSAEAAAHAAAVANVQAQDIAAQRTVVGSPGAKALYVRTQKVWTIRDENQDKVYMHPQIRTQPAVKDAILKCARMLAKAGVEIDGLDCETEEKVA